MCTCTQHSRVETVCIQTKRSSYTIDRLNKNERYHGCCWMIQIQPDLFFNLISNRLAFFSMSLSLFFCVNIIEFCVLLSRFFAISPCLHTNKKAWRCNWRNNTMFQWKQKKNYSIRWYVQVFFPYICYSRWAEKKTKTNETNTEKLKRAK